MIIKKTLSGVLAVLVLLTPVVVAVRVRADDAVRSVQPKGELLFSIKTLEGPNPPPNKRDFGYFFYIEDIAKTGDHPSRYRITGYQVRDGKVVDTFGGGTASSVDFLTQIEAVHFEAFDFDAELKRVQDAHHADIDIVVPFDPDRVEVRFVHRDVNFKLVAWSPVPYIDHAARYSPAIAKLKALLDVVAWHYGRVKMF